VACSIEIRRHSYTKKGDGRGKGSHLSAQGVAFAREIGAHIGPFDFVLTSAIPRTLETAIAMGFAVDDQRDTIGDIPSGVLDEIGHHDRWGWAEPFVRFAELVARGGPTARMGRRQREIWAQALEAVAPQGHVLVVSHGRVMEAGVVACLPDRDYAAWGTPFRHCEGVRMAYEQGQFTNVEFLRVEQLG